jgi:hypothetical protein
LSHTATLCHDPGVAAKTQLAPDMVTGDNRPGASARIWTERSGQFNGLDMMQQFTAPAT